MELLVILAPLSHIILICEVAHERIQSTIRDFNLLAKLLLSLETTSQRLLDGRPPKIDNPSWFLLPAEN
jgi:hypothetical protein